MRLRIIVLTLLAWLIFPIVVIGVYSLFDTDGELNVDLMGHLIKGGIFLYLVVVSLALYYIYKILTKSQKVKKDFVISLLSLIAIAISLIVYFPAVSNYLIR